MRILHGLVVDDLDGGRDEERGYRSLLTGLEPEFHHFGSRKEECLFLLAAIQRLMEERKPEDICRVARTNSLIREEYGAMLKN
jgi:hypothetical protein